MKHNLTLILILCALSTFSQPEKPAVFLSQWEMTADGGQPYNEFYWLNSNDASLTKTGVSFSATGSYRFDISAYTVSGNPVLDVLIDGVSKGNVAITSSSIGIYSLFIDAVSAGSHTITVQLNNFNSGANHVRVALVYFTRTTLTLPYVFPTTTLSSLPTSAQYLTGDHFKSKLLRGFNLSRVYTLSDLAAKNIPAARATGANIGRYWISVSHLPGSTDYYFSNSSGTDLGTTPLTTLDSAVRIAEREGMYLIVTLEVFPDQADCDLWGESAEAIGRRNGLKAIWQQLAARYKDKTIIGGYDLINEPRLNYNFAEYLRWQSEMVEAIRAIDPNHVIAIECLQNKMYAMMLPLPYDNIIYTPHSYSPLSITHQGVNAYQGSTDAQSRRQYPDASTDKSDLSSALKDVRTFSQRFHAPVWIGELSCINWAPMNAQGEWTSTRWIDDDISIIEAEGWTWTYHAWREFQAWDAEIPSSYYDSYTFTNGAPFTRSTKPSNWSSARTSTAPTIVMLKKWFGLNASIQSDNSAPVISITSPVANAAYDSTESIVIEVTASDNDGTISKVEFYNDNVLLGSKTSSPYSFEWKNLKSGNYQLKAKAYDNNGAVTTSSPVQVTVTSLLFTVLAVELVGFEVASIGGGQARLSWRTENESKTSHFEIETFNKSANAWGKIGVIKAAGTSSSFKDYSYITNMSEGLNQFRLKQVSEDGRFRYSSIKTLNNTNAVPVFFNFNPHTREISFRSAHLSDYHFNLIDMSGKVILSRQVNPNGQGVPVPALPSGIYVLMASNLSGNQAVQKIFIY